MERGTEPDRARAVRVRAYLGRVRDVGRTFRAPADTDLAAAMKRAALAAQPLGVAPSTGSQTARHAAPDLPR